MTDDLSPTPDEPELTLKQAARLVGLSTKTLGQYLQHEKVRGRLTRPRANQPRQWLTTRSALDEAGLLEPDADLAPAQDFRVEPLGRSETIAEAILERLDGFLEALGNYAERAGSAGSLAELLAKERMSSDEATRKVVELQVECETLRGKLQEAETELDRERARPLSWGERWTGHRTKHSLDQ